jgi:hypothetical protein
VRIDGQGAAKARYRLVESPLPGQQHAQVVVRGRVVGIQAQGLGQVPRGFVKARQIDAHRPQQRPGVRIVRLVGHYLAIDFPRAVKLAASMEAQSSFQRLGVGRHGGLAWAKT